VQRAEGRGQRAEDYDDHLPYYYLIVVTSFIYHHKKLYKNRYAHDVVEEPRD